MCRNAVLTAKNKLIIVIKLLLSYMGIYLLISYSMENVNLFASLKYLGLYKIVLFCIMVLLLVFLELLPLKNKNINIKRSTLFLTAFFLYLTLNLTINRIEDLKAYLISTCGGVIYFYTLGAALSIITDSLKNLAISKSILRIFNLLYILLAFSFFLLLLHLFVIYLPYVSHSIFLISVSDLKGMYQRPAAFLSIAFLIYSELTAVYFIINKCYRKNNMLKFSLEFALLWLYSLLSIGGMLLSQFLGSNNGLVNLLLLLIITISLYIFVSFSKLKITPNKVKFSQILTGKFTVKMITSILLAIVIVFLLFLELTQKFSVDLTKLRITGYGSGDPGSVNSRLAFLKNFFVQFNYNPFFGNVAVDILTTGKGTYAHSFVLSLLTHLGIVGFILFFIYLFFAMKEYIKEKMNPNKNTCFVSLFKTYNILIFLGIFFVASAATFFTYPVIWFVFGLVFTPIRINKRAILKW